MERILGVTQGTSAEFRILKAADHCLLLHSAGGTWEFEVRTPDDEWVGVEGGSFTESGSYTLEAAAGAICRLTGGDVGSKAWIGSREGDPVQVLD